MNLNVVSFFRPAAQSYDWSSQELAEFYRVEASLARAGIAVETDRGRSDEGDPWFVFCRANSDEVIIHFARFDGGYVVASPAFNSCARGRDFRALIEALIDSHPLVISKAKGGAKLFIHPAALLVALVTTCFFKLGQTDAVAGELKSNLVPSGSGALKASSADTGSQAVILDERATATVLAAVAVAVAWAQSDNGSLWFYDAAPTTEGVAASQGLLASAWVAPTGNAIDALQSARLQAHTLVDFSSASGADTGPLLPAPIVHNVSAVIDQLLSSQKVTSASLTTDFVSDSSQTLKQVSAIFHTAAAVPLVASAQPVQAAVTTTNTYGNSSSAEQEVSGVIGGSLQSHLIVDLNGAEPQLIFSFATNAVVSNHSTNVVVAPVTDNSASVSSSLPSQSASSSPAAASGAAAQSSLSVTVVADSAIQKFMAEYPDFQVIDLTQTHEVIIYDPHLTPTNFPTAIQETFAFNDGSSVVLIGLPTHVTPLGS